MNSHAHEPQNPSIYRLVSPLLERDIVDEFGTRDSLSKEERVQRFLKAIYLDLPIRQTMGENKRKTNQASAQYDVTKSVISIEDKTFDEVFTLEKSRWIGTSDSATIFSLNFQKILRLFLPENICSGSDTSPSVKLYWGLVYRITMVRSETPSAKLIRWFADIQKDISQRRFFQATEGEISGTSGRYNLRCISAP